MVKKVGKGRLKEKDEKILKYEKFPFMCSLILLIFYLDKNPNIYFNELYNIYDRLNLRTPPLAEISVPLLHTLVCYLCNIYMLNLMYVY